MRQSRNGFGLRTAGLLALSFALAAVSSAEVAVAPAVVVPGMEALERRLEAALETRALRRARVSALVVRESDGAVLFERSPDTPLTPASNMKILTAMAALETFGPTWRFETPVFADRKPDAAGAVGALFVQGSGDPVLNSEDWWRLAADLHARGLRAVEGDIVLDASVFDGARWHPDWGAVSSRAYHAPVGGLNANYGAFAVTVRPGARPGEPLAVEVDPPVPYLVVANRARTGPPGQRSTLVVDRSPGSGNEIVTIDGQLGAGDKPRTYYRSVSDPTRYAGAILRMQLEALGVQVSGRVRTGRVPQAAVELLRFKGRSLGEIVRLFVKFSNNAVAESLVKAMGAHTTGQPGSWANGIVASKGALEALGIDLEGLLLIDGSGLSYRDKLTPRALVQALRIARASFRIGPELTAALPIANGDGTLEKRVHAAPGRVRAKTGLLNRVTGLSGFAELPGGDVAVFSVLTNGYRGSDEEAMSALDGFVAILASD